MGSANEVLTGVKQTRRSGEINRRLICCLLLVAMLFAGAAAAEERVVGSYWRMTGDRLAEGYETRRKLASVALGCDENGECHTAIAMGPSCALAGGELIGTVTYGVESYVSRFKCLAAAGWLSYRDPGYTRGGGLSQRQMNYWWQFYLPVSNAEGVIQFDQKHLSIVFELLQGEEQFMFTLKDANKSIREISKNLGKPMVYVGQELRVDTVE
jgi:hypothetical protein